MSRFRFDLDPELERRRNACEREEKRLFLACEDLRARTAAAAEAQRNLEDARQRLRRARDHQTKPPTRGARQFVDGARHVRGVEVEVGAASAAFELAAAERRAAEHRRLLIRRELDEAMAAVGALERLRDRRERAWRRNRAAREERKRDEDALLGWSRGKRRRS